MPPKKIQIKAINALTEKELLDRENKIKQGEEEYKQRLAEYKQREKKLNQRERELEEREIACKEIYRHTEQIKMFLDMADKLWGN